MGKKTKLFISMFISTTALAGALFITGCAGGDTATVTINIGDHVAKTNTPSVVDRIIAFLSLSSRAQAGPVPSDVYDVTVTINGAGMSSITQSIPETGVITLDVPSGPARVFTVVGHDVDGARYMGGIATKDLAAGESVILPIQMGELPMIPSDPYAYTSSGITLYWDYYGDPESLIGFIIYRSSQLDGLFVPIAAGRKEDFENDGYRFNDPTGGSSMSSNPSFYKIAATNAYGVGQSTYAVYSSC